MLNDTYLWFIHLAFTSWIGFGLYWVPLGLCAYGYTVRTWVNYRRDITLRDTEKHYIPRDTVGTLLGRTWVSITPVVNIWAAAFDVAPPLFGSLFDWFGRLFDQPLVPKRNTKDYT